MSLIEEAKNRNPDAFDRLMRNELQRMYRIAISMLQNEEDAADAIQETVLKCWQKIGQLKQEAYFRTWLTRILINQCKDVLKNRKRYVSLDDFEVSDFPEPEGEAAIIASKEEYEGEGIAFAKADGILYLPEREMTEEEILQLVVFHLLEQYVDYEAYVKADNPLYYLNAFDAMTMQEVDTFYVNYRAANTETGFYSRALSFEELGQRKALKILYKNGEKHPEHTMPVIEEEGAYTGEEVAFCKSNCTIYFPEGALTEEQLLELIDFEMKADYCRQRIAEEVSVGIRSDWPHIDYVERERTLTLDPDMVVEDEILSQPWLYGFGL